MKPKKSLNILPIKVSKISATLKLNKDEKIPKFINFVISELLKED
tara:strand:+ start:2318 stop:2452 length:135 start_codon:yes stop_codon:yes gene_type:complete